MCILSGLRRNPGGKFTTGPLRAANATLVLPPNMHSLGLQLNQLLTFLVALEQDTLRLQDQQNVARVRAIDDLPSLRAQELVCFVDRFEYVLQGNEACRRHMHVTKGLVM